jgi:hypothetical protein
MMPMAGGIILAVVLVIVIPVGVMMAGAVASALLGWSLKSDADTRYEGHELVELNT